MKEKKLYWLKMKQGFFDDKAIKKLRSLAGGDTYTIIYLKMLLTSLKENGIIYYDGIESTFPEEVALEISENPDDVKMTMAYLQAKGLLETNIDQNFLFMTEVPELVGSETTAAARKRKQRAKNLNLERNNVTNASHLGHTDIDIDIEKDIDIDIEKECERTNSKPYSDNCIQNGYKLDTEVRLDNKKSNEPEKPVRHKYGEYQNVLLNDNDFEKLKAEFPDDWEDRIERLSSYMRSTGKSYKDHLCTIRNWARKDNKHSPAGGKSILEEWGNA